jgi:aspartyl-tRNA(Asn)/glutamyl-tRNA(Gln) amidotransferase subunit A
MMKTQSTDLLALSGCELLGHYASRTISPLEVTRATLHRLARDEPRINAFTLIDEVGALSAAQASEERWMRRAPIGLADGLLVTVKDNLLWSGFPNRRGSAVTSRSLASEDAPCVARLKENGAIVLGKTTMPELGWKGVTDSLLSGITRNPWNLRCTPGGSSGGAAAAAALGIGHLHLGTDAAGSIRIPAAFSGVFGIKPSFGRVPAWPASPFNVLSHVGPLARHVSDAALLLTIIAAPDWRDNFAWNTAAPDYRLGIEDGVRSLRIAWSPRLGSSTTINKEIAGACEKAAQLFNDLGASVEVADPLLEDPRSTIDALWNAGAAAALAPFPLDQRHHMDRGLLAAADLGERMMATTYLAAFSARAPLALAMARFHQRYDLLITPQMPLPAFEAGRDTPADGSFGQDWLNWSPFTYPFNLTQQPAASVPCALTTDGLPIGLQIIGPMGADAMVLRAARAFERACPLRSIDEPRS